MNNKCLLTKPGVLLNKSKIGVQIGVKIPRETGFQFGKKQSDELTYTHISDRQTYNDKIQNLIWNI